MQELFLSPDGGLEDSNNTVKEYPAVSPEEQLLHEWRTGTGDGTNQPIIHGHRLPTDDEMKKGPIFGAPTMMAPGETYDQAVLNWATYICNSGKANPGFCEWSYTIGNEPADGWDALFVVIGAAGLAAGGRGASVKAAPKLTVDDVMTTPKLLAGMTPAQVEKLIGNTPNWVIGTMNKGRNAGSGWTFREMNAAGTDYTGRYIQWHPGSTRHYGGAPYWKVSNGQVGTVRFPQ